MAREAKELQGKTSSQKKEEVKEEKKTSSTEGDTFEIVRISLKTTNQNNCEEL